MLEPVKDRKGEERKETESQRGPGTNLNHTVHAQQRKLGTLRRARLFQVSAHGFTRKLPWSLLFPIILGKGKLRS